MSRVLGAARLYTIRPQASLAVPWLVGLSSFAINVAVWGFAGLRDEPSAGTGGLAALYISVVAVFTQAVTQMFPFALSMGLSRRTFYAGTALMATLQAVVYAVVLTVLIGVEGATGGWAVGLHFWGPYGLEQHPVGVQFAVHACGLIGAAFLGIAIGVVAKRWGPAGLWTLAIGALLVLGGAAVLVTALQGWTGLWDWIVDRSVLTIALLYAAVFGLVSAGLSYAGLRRAVP
jgi:hypothetical protein